MIVRSKVLALCLLTFLTSCAKAPPQAAPAAPPRPSLSDFIRTTIAGPGVSRGTWGIVVESISRNERLFEHNPRTYLVPASVAKIVAVAAGVEGVGWNHTFETTLQTNGTLVDGVLQGDLIVTGSGDPSIGGRGGDDFTAWVDALKAAGIRRIDGRVIGDDDAFDDPRPGAMWAWDDLGYTSGSLYGALNFAENRMTVTVTPGRSEGSQVTLGVEPFAAERPLGSRVVTGAAGSMPLIWPEQRPGEYFLTIGGSLPAGSAPVRLNVSAGNPTFWFVSVLRNRLLRDGIEITGAAFDIDDVSPKPDLVSRRVLHSHRSRPLADVTTPLLKDSINIYAEAVLRLSTGPTGGRTNDDALEAIRGKLPSWGLPPDALQVVDGSGLSRRDAIAADTIVALLKRLYDPGGESPWMKGLPIAGRDGTLQNRLRGTTAEGNVLGKTGTMSNIRSLAGYVRTRDGEPLAFTIMVNNFEGTGAQAQAAIDAIAVRLAEFSR